MKQIILTLLVGITIASCSSMDSKKSTDRRITRKVKITGCPISHTNIDQHYGSLLLHKVDSLFTVGDTIKVNFDIYEGHNAVIIK